MNCVDGNMFSSLNKYDDLEYMKNHREIFYLADQFTDKVNRAENELSSKADEVKKNLSSNYNTFIYSPIHYLKA